MPVDDVCFPQWENRVRIASQSDALLSSLEKDSRRYGIVVHDLMSRINVPEDVAPVVDEYCREHHIVQRDAESILRRITDMVNSPENRRYFDPHYSVRCEASIAVGGEVRRPDRIVYDDKETFVVDFKTGTYNEETHRKYQRQVAEYADALTAMGFPNVKAVIIYL
jgi:ATP-dependent exoDNAse (exonuclease V) beta subunit